MTTNDVLVVAARRRVVDALYAMHSERGIRIDETLAKELDEAWDAYDAALLAAHVVPQTGKR